jgi:L-fucose isomerase-like protein
MAVQLAEALQTKGAPLLLWATPDARDGGRLRLNSLCGINLAGHALDLRGIPYDYLLAQPDDATVLSKIAHLARVGYARRQLSRARVGLIGEHPAGFDTCAYDAGHLSELFGLQVKPLPLADTLQRAATVDTATRQAFVDRVGEHAHNLADLDQTALSGTAGVYGALRGLVDEQRLQGVAVRCWPEFFTELGCAACGAMSLLNKEQCPASCEADVNGTVTSLLLQALSGEPAFITDLVSIDAESDTGVLWHCGLAPVSMADPAAPILGTIHSNRKLPLLFEFPLKPGRVTIARLHRVTTRITRPGGPRESRNTYQLVIGGGEMMRAPKSFSGTSGVVRFDQPATTVFDTVMRHGLEHHFCITYGDYQAELAMFAHLVGLPVLQLT